MMTLHCMDNTRRTLYPRRVALTPWPNGSLRIPSHPTEPSQRSGSPQGATLGSWTALFHNASSSVITPRTPATPATLQTPRTPETPETPRTARSSATDIQNRRRTLGNYLGVDLHAPSWTFRPPANQLSEVDRPRWSVSLYGDDLLHATVSMADARRHRFHVTNVRTGGGDVLRQWYLRYGVHGHRATRAGRIQIDRYGVTREVDSDDDEVNRRRLADMDIVARHMLGRISRLPSPMQAAREGSMSSR